VPYDVKFQKPNACVVQGYRRIWVKAA
jgi:hypothetical protein